MSKRVHFIQKFVGFKSNSSPNHFSFFVFDFNVSNKISSTPTQLLKFFPPPSHPCLFQTPWLLCFEELSNVPVYSNLCFYQALKSKCLTVFCSVICTVTLCMYCIRHIQNFFRYMRAYSIMFSVIKGYSRILRHY